MRSDTLVYKDNFIFEFINFYVAFYLGHECRHTFQICSFRTWKTFYKVLGDAFHTPCSDKIDDLDIAHLCVYSHTAADIYRNHFGSIDTESSWSSEQ